VILKRASPAQAAAARGPRRKFRARIAFALALSDHRRGHSTHVCCNVGLPGSAEYPPHNCVLYLGKPHGGYFRGLPRFGKTNPHASAVQRSRLANLSASLRSGPGGIRRASSKASVARVSQSSLSVERCVSLLIAPQSSRYMDSSKSFDSRTQI
jgi:hypothetical protein